MFHEYDSFFCSFRNFRIYCQVADVGCVLVTLGSMLCTQQIEEGLKEMNAAFAHLPQRVIWMCKPYWPKDGLLRMTLWVRTSSLYKQQPFSLSFFFRVYCSCHSYLGTPPSLKRKTSVSKNQSIRKDWHFGVTSFICNPDQLSVATSDIKVGLLWPLVIGR